MATFRIYSEAEIFSQSRITDGKNVAVNRRAFTTLTNAERNDGNISKPPVNIHAEKKLTILDNEENEILSIKLRQDVSSSFGNNCKSQAISQNQYRQETIAAETLNHIPELSSSENSTKVIRLEDENARKGTFDFEEYGETILENLKQSESKYRVKATYMNKHHEISHVMRTTLINWLIEVAEEYDLQSETLCLAVSYLDRFLSVMSVVRSKLQLVGIAALYISAKYEETSPPDVHEFVYIADNTYTVAQILRMEQLMLRALKFDLCAPTSIAFLNIFHVFAKSDDELRVLSQYIAEMALLDGTEYLAHLPSEIAAAALALARLNMNQSIWSKKLEATTGYSVEYLRQLILKLSKSYAASGTIAIRALYVKYTHRVYLGIAHRPPADVNENTLAKAIHLTNVMTEVDGDDDTAAVRTENVRKIMSRLIFD